MNNADSIIDNNDQKFKLNQTSDTNISRITYHTDLNLSNDNVNLSESSSFQYFGLTFNFFFSTNFLTDNIIIAIEQNC